MGNRAISNTNVKRDIDNKVIILAFFLNPCYTFHEAETQRNPRHNGRIGAI